MSIKEQMADFLPEFSRKLLGLCQMMVSVRYASLALHIPVSALFLSVIYVRFKLAERFDEYFVYFQSVYTISNLWAWCREW